MWQYLVLLGAAVNLFGSAFCIRDTLRGETKPNRVTWLMWSVAPFIATGAGLAAGVTWAVVPVFMSGFIPFLVFLASFVNRNSYWKLGLSDYICGFLSVLALVFWWLTKEPNIAIVFAILSDTFAAAPTLVKLWKYPESESVIVYEVGIFSALTTFAAIKSWQFSELAFPIYVLCMDVILTLFFYGKRIFKNKIL